MKRSMGDNPRLRNTSERFQKFCLIAVNVPLHVSGDEIPDNQGKTSQHSYF
jgi:hypothetical protein